MSLSTKQIAEIRNELAAQPCHYTDILDEITDHAASMAESLMEVKGLRYEEAKALALSDIDIEKIQRQRTLKAFTMPYRAMFKGGSLGNFAAFLIALAIIALAFSLSTNVTQTYKWLQTVLIAASVIPAVLSIADQKNKPYQMSYFIVAIIGCSLSMQVWNALGAFVIEELFEASLTANFLYYLAGTYLLLTCYRSIWSMYQKVLRYALH